MNLVIQRRRCSYYYYDQVMTNLFRTLQSLGAHHRSSALILCHVSVPHYARSCRASARLVPPPQQRCLHQRDVEKLEACYQTLGVKKDEITDSSKIRKAYHAKLKLYHPDTNPHEPKEKILEVSSESLPRRVPAPERLELIAFRSTGSSCLRLDMCLEKRDKGIDGSRNLSCWS